MLEGLKEGQTFDFIPKKFEGFVLKKRKWPLKGYHKVSQTGITLNVGNGIKLIIKVKVLITRLLWLCIVK